MGDFERTHTERVSRQQAAERLTDLAYALTAGGSVQLSLGGRRVTVLIAEEVCLQRGARVDGEHVGVELRVSWSTAGDSLDHPVRVTTAHAEPTHPDHSDPLSEEGAPSMPSEQSLVDEVRAKLESDSRMHNPAEVAVADQGGTVTLRGTVRSLHQRRTAVELAKSVPGVVAVDDQLRVDPRDHWQDEEIRGAALQALISSPQVPADRVDVSVSAGWLTLKGDVKRQSESDAAFAAVSGVTGAGGITNDIRVITAGVDG
jgi:amphi-Trp domain-containing protein